MIRNLLLFLLISFSDTLHTAIMYGNGLIVEYNPLMSFLFRIGIWYFILVKLAIFTIFPLFILVSLANYMKNKKFCYNLLKLGMFSYMFGYIGFGLFINLLGG